MRKLYDLIHSPTALLSFEAAARNLSFSKAAAELNVSQPAISAAVRKIEQALGARLFERRNRGISLTETGEKFYADVSFGLMHILRSAEAVRQRNDGSHVTISCSTAFAHYWLVPRLARFRALYPGIDIRMETTDRDTDLRQSAVSLGVRRGGGAWIGYGSAKLADDRIVAVCSPAYLAAHGEIPSVAALATCQLIHLDEPFRLRPRWADWFSAAGHAFRDTGGGLRLNDYALVLQAAIAGEGIAFGWTHLIAPLIEKGILVQVTEHALLDGSGHYVIWPDGSEPSANARLFLEWLIAQEDQSREVSAISGSGLT